ncbi:MAG TPA: MlaD family protein [Steroidobacteraceae bacterium]
MNQPAPLIVEKARWKPQLVWVVPIVAALVGASLVVQSWRSRGPRIVITFQSADGLQVGKTLVKYRSIAIGRVAALALDADAKAVEVTVDLDRSGAGAATEGTRFWVQHPRLGLEGNAQLDSLLSGSFIGVDPGNTHKAQHEFVGLEEPPALSHGPAGRLVTLHADNLGSIAPGAPVYFRQVRVGRVISTGLSEDRGGVRINAFIDAPNDGLLSPRSRFWNASGIDLSLNADGLKVKTQSLSTILAGGIAFEDAPPETVEGGSVPAPDFTLYQDRTSAFAPAPGEARLVKMRFRHALRGLRVGAPVEMVGVDIGRVTAIDLEFSPKDESFTIVVSAALYPQLMGPAYETLAAAGTANSDDRMAALVGRLVNRGLRVQPRLGSLITGQLYLAMDFLPSPNRAVFDASKRPLELPTAESTTGELQVRVASIAEKLDRLPLSSIAGHLDGDLVTLQSALTHLDRDVLPPAGETVAEARSTLSALRSSLANDSPFRERIDRTLEDTDATLAEIRALAGYLERHPDALLKGRRPDSNEAKKRP